MTIGTPLWDEFVANLKEVKVTARLQRERERDIVLFREVCLNSCSY